MEAEQRELREAERSYYEDEATRERDFEVAAEVEAAMDQRAMRDSGSVAGSPRAATVGAFASVPIWLYTDG
eukprot:165806-Alexandrium_andersonii.AAC.1